MALIDGQGREQLKHLNLEKSQLPLLPGIRRYSALVPLEVPKVGHIFKTLKKNELFVPGLFDVLTLKLFALCFQMTRLHSTLETIAQVQAWVHSHKRAELPDNQDAIPKFPARQTNDRAHRFSFGSSKGSGGSDRRQWTLQFFKKKSGS